MNIQSNGKFSLYDPHIVFKAPNVLSLVADHPLADKEQILKTNFSSGCSYVSCLIS